MPTGYDGASASGDAAYWNVAPRPQLDYGDGDDGAPADDGADLLPPLALSGGGAALSFGVD